MNKIIVMRTDRQAAILDQFAKTLDGSEIMVEVGSYTGESAVVFARYVKKLVCVDPWSGGYDPADIASGCDYNEVMQMFLARTKGCRNVSHIRMNSVEAAKSFEDGTLDVVYIDGAHDYQNVKDDILAWMPKLKAGGILAGHDYGSHAPGVVKAVEKIIGKPSMVYAEKTWVR